MSDDQKQGGATGPGRRRRRRRGSTPRVGPAASAPVPAAPVAPQAQPTVQATATPRRGRQPAPKRAPKKPPAEPRIGVGCIVLRGDEILMVREKGRWSLPKGGLNNFQMTENNNLVISSAKGIGCSVVNIGAADIRCVDARAEQADIAARVAST